MKSVLSRVAHQTGAYLLSLWHDMTRSIELSPRCQSIARFVPGLSSIRRCKIKHRGGERQCESEVSCLRTQHNAPDQDTNTNRSIRRSSRAH